jgi:hypothetical protein
MLLGTRNKQVDLRCAVGTFNVKDGVVEPESFIVDTSETLVNVTGRSTSTTSARPRTRGPRQVAERAHAAHAHRAAGTVQEAFVHRSGPAGRGRSPAPAALAAVAPRSPSSPSSDSGKKQDADCDKLMAEAREKAGSGSTTEESPPGEIIAA